LHSFQRRSQRGTWYGVTAERFQHAGPDKG
jgi:hypothetical protein